MTIKWDAEHPDSNTCVEQWHYNVDFLLNNDRCSSDDFLNRDDGSIDMIVYKVEGPRSNFGGITSISSMGNPKDFEWLRNRTKPTARQISISKSLTESMVKQKLDWPLYTPSPNRECLYKVASPGKTPEKTESMLDWPLYAPPPTENASIKWPVQVKPLKKENLCWNGHFIPPPPTENASNTLSLERGPQGEWGSWGAKMASILRPFWRARARRAQDPHSPWGPLSREIFSIKWPVQVKPLKKQNLCWTGHFIEKKISLERIYVGLATL